MKVKESVEICQCQQMYRVKDVVYEVRKAGVLDREWRL